MRICEKISMDTEGLLQHGPITIVAFGDSITHGAFDVDEFDYESVYWNRLRKKINAVRNYVPINVIDAGIGGITAHLSLDRMEKQVFSHNPDLVIVCFGLNDINDDINVFLKSLRTIFERCKVSGAETIYMSPNMFNTYVSDDVPPELVNFAKITAEYQNSGRMDIYICEAVKLARSMGITVCDCYSKWKEISKTNDTTKFLANKINHPTREMHELFAQSLFDEIFKEK